MDGRFTRKVKEVKQNERGLGMSKFRTSKGQNIESIFRMIRTSKDQNVKIS
jgi:hypothetical protein